MTRTIKPKDITPGMTVRWGEGGISYQCTLVSVKLINDDEDVQGKTPQGRTVLIAGDKDVVVVKEPTRPAEPAEFGALVTVDGRRAVRIQGKSATRPEWALESEHGATLFRVWSDLLKLGEVKIPGERPADGTAPLTWGRWKDIPEGTCLKHSALSHTYRKTAGGRVQVQLSTGEWTEVNKNLVLRLTGWTETAQPEGPTTWRDWDDVPPGVPVRTPSLSTPYRRGPDGGIQWYSSALGGQWCTAFEGHTKNKGWTEADTTWRDWDDVPPGVPVRTLTLKRTYRRRADGDIQFYDRVAGWRAAFEGHKRMKNWIQVEEPCTGPPVHRDAEDKAPRTWSHWTGIPVGVQVTTPSAGERVYRRTEDGMEAQYMGKYWTTIPDVLIPAYDTWTEYMS